MYPIVTTIELFGNARVIGSYGLMLTTAFLVFGGLLLVATRRRGLDPGLVVAVLACAVPAAALGAYALSVLVSWLHGAIPIQAALRPALTFYGGAAGLVSGLVLGARVAGVPAADLVDEAIVPGALAHGLGRLGCMLGGCCYGLVHGGALAVSYDHPLAPASDGLPRHPVQAYEAIALAILAGVFTWLIPPRRDTRRSHPWLRFRLYLGAYAVLRFGLEFLRGDPDRGLWLGGAASTSQLISIALVILLLSFGGRRLGAARA